MLILRATTDFIKAVTGSAADVRVTRSVMIADSAAPPAIKAIPDLGPLAAISSATTTTIVDTSGGTSGDNWNVKDLSFYNAHASTSTTLQVTHYDGSNTAIIWNGTLLAGEMAKLTQNGAWIHYDSNGGVYPSVGNAAVQSDMEAGTASDRYVTPGMMKYDQGSVKGWCKSTGATGARVNAASYNVTSLTDTGTGDMTFNWSTAFSSASYAVHLTTELTATTFAVANDRKPYVRSGGQAAGSVRCNCIDSTAITMLVKDPTAWHIAAYGDFA